MYDAGVPDWGTSSASNIPNDEVSGSFTWKLTPNASHDMTPNTEVNEASTVYKINISPNNYNQNNIDKWKTYIAQNGSNTLEYCTACGRRSCRH